MKKILSLLSLFMLAVGAMAQTAVTYAGTWHSPLAAFADFEGKISVATQSDGRYTIVLKDLVVGDDNLGNVTLSNVASNLYGSTDWSQDGGTTTITAGYFELQGNSISDDEVSLKFRYFEYNSLSTRSVTFVGTKNEEGGGDVVEDEYPINFDKDASAIRSDRYLTSVSLTEEGGEAQTVAAGSTNPYVDKSADGVFTVKAGSQLTPSFNYSGSWMHGYVYVDENQDKQFSFNDGNTDQSGTELKTFSFYSGSFTDDSNGVNSNGDAITGDARNVLDPPSFTAPSTPGTYRIRFKVDWNSVDPGGQKAADGTCTGSNGILANGGVILDATLVVEESEAPNQPVVYTNTLNEVRGTEKKVVENAQISVLNNGDGTYKFSLPAFSDMDEYEGFVKLEFNANGTEADGKTTFSAENVNVELDDQSTGWNGYAATVSMNGELVGDQLTATFKVNLGGLDGYDYTLGFGVMPFVPTTTTYKDVANIKFGDNTVDFDEATAELTDSEEGTYTFAYKDVTVNGNNIGDLTISDIAAADGDNGVKTFSASESTIATWTRVTENNALGVDAGDEAAVSNLEGSLTPAAEEGAEAKLVVKFDVALGGETASVVFGEKSTPEESKEITIVEDYKADGTGFSYTEPIDWDTQKFVASIDASTCQRSVEHLIGVGVDGTSWNKNVHVYWASGNTLQCYWDGNDGGGNNNTGKFSYDGNIKIEISKANGLVVDGAKKISADNMSALYDLTSIVIGSGEASNQESYATYNYMKIVPLDWTDQTVGIGGINADAIDSSADIFTISGVKVNTLQKGVNIVRTANGKTVKIVKK